MHSYILADFPFVYVSFVIWHLLFMLGDLSLERLLAGHQRETETSSTHNSLVDNTMHNFPENFLLLCLLCLFRVLSHLERFEER